VHQAQKGLNPIIILYYTILLNKLAAILLSEKFRKSKNVREIGRG